MLTGGQKYRRVERPQLLLPLPLQAAHFRVATPRVDGKQGHLGQVFTAQMAALQRYRSGSKQKITVQHVNVESGGSAVVGDINGGVMGKWRGPPHGTMRKCGAKTRQGHPCGHVAMKNGRCRLHGGKITGARNPSIVHGQYTKEAVAFRRLIATLLRESSDTVKKIDSDSSATSYTNDGEARQVPFSRVELQIMPI